MNTMTTKQKGDKMNSKKNNFKECNNCELIVPNHLKICPRCNTNL